MTQSPATVAMISVIPRQEPIDIILDIRLTSLAMTTNLENWIHQFNPELPIDRALTPPSSWYEEPEFEKLENRTVFRNTWQFAGRLDQVQKSGDFFTGELAGESYLVVRNKGNKLQAFFNVCQHHAAQVAKGGGNCAQFVCPYHGWTYELNGDLRAAPRFCKSGKDPQSKDGNKVRLVEIPVTEWGPFVLVQLRPYQSLEESEESKIFDHLKQTLKPLDESLKALNNFDGLNFHCTKSYEINCNWKVFVDNYLDGGYHVPVAHRGLAAQLDLSKYSIEVFDELSLQITHPAQDSKPRNGDFGERIGSGAVYAYVYPNFMLNRYGPMMDSNWVIPVSTTKCITVFDYFFDMSNPICTDEFIQRSLEASDVVQQEDIALCESVQKGITSQGYDVGLYAPDIEQPALAFHRKLFLDFKQHLERKSPLH